MPAQRIGDKTGADLLCQIISQRYERGSIAITIASTSTGPRCKSRHGIAKGDAQPEPSGFGGSVADRERSRHRASVPTADE